MMCYSCSICFNTLVHETQSCLQLYRDTDVHTEDGWKPHLAAEVWETAQVVLKVLGKENSRNLHEVTHVTLRPTDSLRLSTVVMGRTWMTGNIVSNMPRLRSIKVWLSLRGTFSIQWWWWWWHRCTKVNMAVLVSLNCGFSPFVLSWDYPSFFQLFRQCQSKIASLPVTYAPASSFTPGGFL